MTFSSNEAENFRIKRGVLVALQVRKREERGGLTEQFKCSYVGFLDSPNPMEEINSESEEANRLFGLLQRRGLKETNVSTGTTMIDRKFDILVEESRRRSRRLRKLIGATSSESQVSGNEFTKRKTSNAGMLRRALKNKVIGGGSGGYCTVKCVRAKSGSEYQAKREFLRNSRCKLCRSRLFACP